MKQNLHLTTPSFPKRRLGSQRGVGKQFTSDHWTVLLEFSIRADARRLFHALTMPEYIETWISFPGHRLGCATVAATAHRDYVIQHQCKDKPAVSITGTYSVCQRHNLTFSWRVEGTPCVPESCVDIRLRGNFENTTLLLRHSGFESANHCAWHRALWSASIGKLIGLYDSSSYGYEASKPRIGNHPAVG
jgi:uncharacterized protein YndB with AHSA1/START domain